MNKMLICAAFAVLAGTLCAEENLNTNYLWSASAAGPIRSSDSGATWQLATGTGDGMLPSGLTYTAIMSVGSFTTFPVTNKLILLGTTTGLYRTIDNGGHWYHVSGTGSYLESTSQNVGALLSTITSFGTTDVLVGMVGSTNGGVYLSGDAGAHWTLINLGFDPNSLSISSFVKTSCSGCPVQYYSGNYGSGVYTRTIPVNAPPQITGWCFGATACTCNTTPLPSGPSLGGQSFKLCGQNIQAGAAIEFGWTGNPFNGGRFSTIGVNTVNNSSCVYTAYTIQCTGSGETNLCASNDLVYGTPHSEAGNFYVEVRNPDTRSGFMTSQYTFTPAPQY